MPDSVGTASYAFLAPASFASAATIAWGWSAPGIGGGHVIEQVNLMLADILDRLDVLERRPKMKPSPVTTGRGPS